MSTVNSGLGWSCDSDYYGENTNTSNYISAFDYDLPFECVNADSNYPVGDHAWTTAEINESIYPKWG